MSKNLSNASISHANGIITTKLYGIFNESSAESYRAELFKLVMGLKGKPFALLADISQVEGATPEAFDMVKHIINRLPEMGLVAKAYVYKGPVIRGIMYQRIPELVAMDYLFFTRFESAFEWLEQEYKSKLQSLS
ncbi:hypothetical protein [Alteromonas sp. PRIM-21]|uniref:hypothetical protein n=1 Tax=Alteromonas sp. PRIM-21 TaxID=1454978 RepID=UPI0022B95C81|nr:hypothetical protein [Alteromonas sp. PRIM-21]MCZ8531329.1 hypothetical protein [Alteromonas sp. PRIM-21]